MKVQKTQYLPFTVGDGKNGNLISLHQIQSIISRSFRADPSRIFRHHMSYIESIKGSSFANHASNITIGNNSHQMVLTVHNKCNTETETIDFLKGSVH